MTNFNLLQTAIKKGCLISFDYVAKNGVPKKRLGFVHELDAKTVTICDVHKNSYRKSIIAKIQGDVQFLNPQPVNPYR